jgi:hypothetical protein
MSTTVKKHPRKQFPVPPEGLFQAVCVDAWDIWVEKRPEQWGGGLIDKTRLVWQLAKNDKEGRPYQVSKMYTASLHEKANLRKDLESWRGRKFTKEEEAAFELENLVGANCQIQIIHNVGNDGITYANVQTIVPPQKGVPKMRASADFVRKKDRKDEDRRYDGAVGDDGGPTPSNDDDDVPF